MRRRTFVRGMAAAVVGGPLCLASSRSVFGSEANERIRLAVLGHMYVAAHFFSSLHVYPQVELVALCNPDRRRFGEILAGWDEQAKKGEGSPQADPQRAAALYRRLASSPPPLFADFRQMFDQMADQIDALVVSMFDHYHGVACGRAMRAGKHVFCERPLGLSIRDSRALRQLAAEAKVATSIRNPGNASAQFRRGVELLREGVIGPVEEVHVWFDRGGPDFTEPPQGTEPVPEGLDWDVWLGPAAWRPYHSQWMSYAYWREFSNGGIGTFGPHAANLAFMGLRVQDLWAAPADAGPHPSLRVEADCSRRNRLSFPQWEIVRWDVPARGTMPAVRFTWYNGRGHAPGARQRIQELLSRLDVTPDEQDKCLAKAGALILGREGALLSDDHNVTIVLLPRAKFQHIAQDRPQTLPASRGHYMDWLLACRGAAPAWACFDYAGPLSEFLMLGNLATQFEGPLHYDPVAGQIVNHAEAQQALGYEYRDGWHI